MVPFSVYYVYPIKKRTFRHQLLNDPGDEYPVTIRKIVGRDPTHVPSVCKGSTREGLFEEPQRDFKE